jgi:hypothetical protein
MRPSAPIALLVLAACLRALPARADEPPAPAAHPDAGKAAPADAPKAVDPAKAAADAAAAAELAKAAAARHTALVKQGKELCDAGEVDQGLVALDAAWSQQDDPDLALALANCEIKAQRWPGAAEHLAYVLRATSDPEARKGIEPTFVDVRRRVGAVKVKVTLEGADVFVADHYAGQSPLNAEVYVLPGRARVSAKKPGYAEVERGVDVQANGTAEITLDLAGESDVGRSRPEPIAPRSRTPAYVLGGLTLVAAGVGAALVAGGAAQGSAGDSLLGELQGAGGKYPCPTAPGCATLQSLRSGHDTWINAGIGVFGVDGALLGATIIYSLWATRAPERASLSFAPVASAGSGGIVARGAF